MRTSSGLLAIAALLPLSCGGGLAGTGSYCIEVDPTVYTFDCTGGEVDVTVTNLCGAPIVLSGPLPDAVCAERVTISPEDGASLEDGDSVVYRVTYSDAAVTTEAWDCTVAFPHDLAGEPAPEVPLAGGGQACGG